LIGIIAGICAFGFAKLSRHHKQDNNGGAYIFARSAFGRFVGFLTLFLNYIIMPLALSNQILMFIKANVDPTMSTFGGTPITGES
jgi:amino acid transporter